MAATAWQHIRNATANTRPDPAVLVDGQLALNTAAATPAVYFKDSAGNLALVGAAFVSDTAPNDPAAGFAGNSIGEFWFNKTTKELSTYTATGWQLCGSGTEYILPPAAAEVLGGVKIGSGLDVTADGTVSVNIDIVELKGSADPTVAAPAAPTLGNAYIANATGPAEASWVGITPEVVTQGDLLLFDGTEWILNRSTSGTGPTGPQGEQGPAGADGAEGPQGPAGPSAVSADAGNLAALGSDSLIFVSGDEGTY